jgi:hypothetical protein
LEKYIRTTFEKYPNPDLDVLYVGYSTYDKAVQSNIAEIVAKYHAFKRIQFNLCSCNCCVHSGKNIVGLFYLTAQT